MIRVHLTASIQGPSAKCGLWAYLQTTVKSSMRGGSPVLKVGLFKLFSILQESFLVLTNRRYVKLQKIISVTADRSCTENLWDVS